MDKFAPASSDASRTGTSADSRFTAQATTAEDILKEQTVGLVNLNDFRKRRAEALEQKERSSCNASSGTTTPHDGASKPQPSFKKKRTTAAKGKLSFEVDEDEDGERDTSSTPTRHDDTPIATTTGNSEIEGTISRKKLAANANVGFKPRVMTKAALAREAKQADLARKEFLVMREAVKATEVVIPFVFYDGTNIPGGRCRMKKGDHVWLFLDKARKVGAELGVGGDRSRRDWARVSVDDLMLVRGEVILPHHYEFYYFLFNKVVGFSGLIFEYSAETTKTSPLDLETDRTASDDFEVPGNHERSRSKGSTIPDSELEGFHDDPTITKVVDRRWYERNKHIFPASVWEEYAPDKELSSAQRKDTEGNTFFFS